MKKLSAIEISILASEDYFPYSHETKSIIHMYLFELYNIMQSWVDNAHSHMHVYWVHYNYVC